MAVVIFCQPATVSLQVGGRVVRAGLGLQPCRLDGSLVRHGLVASGFPGGDLCLGWLDPVGRQILQDQQVPLLVVLLGAVCTIRPKIRLASADQRRCRASAR